MGARRIVWRRIKLPRRRDRYGLEQLGALAPLMGATALGLATAGCPETCTEIGCGTGAEVELRVEQTLQQLTEGRVEACHTAAGDVDCVSLTPRVDEWTFRTDNFGYSVESIDGEPREDVQGYGATVSERVAESANEVTVRVEWFHEDPEQASVGDEYSVRIFDADGTEIGFKVRQVRSIRVWFPNGKDCPRECHTLEFEDGEF